MWLVSSLVEVTSKLYSISVTGTDVMSQNHIKFFISSLFSVSKGTTNLFASGCILLLEKSPAIVSLSDFGVYTVDLMRFRRSDICFNAAPGQVTRLSA